MPWLLVGLGAFWVATFAGFIACAVVAARADRALEAARAEREREQPLAVVLPFDERRARAATRPHQFGVLAVAPSQRPRSHGTRRPQR